MPKTRNQFIGFKSWYQPDEAGAMFDQHYTELWGAHVALKAALPWWERKGFKNAWQRYAMPGYYNDIPETEYTRMFPRGTPQTIEEARKKNSEFINYLRQLRQSWPRRVWTMIRSRSKSGLSG